MNIGVTGLEGFQKSLLWTKVASALEGLSQGKLVTVASLPEVFGLTQSYLKISLISGD